MSSQLRNPNARVFPAEQALPHLTHLAIMAHQDDTEIIAADGPLTCLSNKQFAFGTVVCTDGTGCPREGRYKDLTDDQMRDTREREQELAAVAGRYACVVQLRHPSQALGTPGAGGLIEDLTEILALTLPEIVYTHNPADKHDTHVGVTQATLAAIRRLPGEFRPQLLLGCEGWRGLDWLPDEDKVILDLSGKEVLWMKLVRAFDSQISGGKRYDEAALGRSRCNATYLDPRNADEMTNSWFALDLTPLIRNDRLSLEGFTLAFLDRFRADVQSRLRKYEP